MLSIAEPDGENNQLPSLLPLNAVTYARYATPSCSAVGKATQSEGCISLVRIVPDPNPVGTECPDLGSLER